MYLNFFIPSPVDGHLGCFHVLAIVNSAAVNIGVHVSFSIMVFSGYLPVSGDAGSYGNFIPSFLRIQALFIEETVFSPFYILAFFVKHKVSIGAWIYRWAFYFVPFIYISVFVPGPYVCSQED